jgi:hypothetical protein
MIIVREVGILLMLPGPLQEFLYEQLDFIQVIKADLVKFFRSYLMVEVDHPVPIACHLSHQIRFHSSQDFLLKKTLCNLSIFRGGISKPLRKDMPAEVKERFS